MNTKLTSIIASVFVIVAFISCGDQATITVSDLPSDVAVIYVSPGNFEADISVTPTIVAVFNKPVKKEDAVSHIALKVGDPTAKDSVESDIAYDEAKQTLQLKPKKALDLATTYAVVITAGIAPAEENNGAALEADVVSYFTTTSLVGSTPFYVVNISPPQGAVDIGVDVIPEVTFSLPVQKENISRFAHLQLVRNKGKDRIEVEVTAEVTEEKPNIIFITPKEPLTEGEEYAIMVEAKLQAENGTILTAPVESHFRVWEANPDAGDSEDTAEESPDESTETEDTDAGESEG